ncbi:MULTISPECIES: ATP-binding protein [unclassified Marinobacterium]|uniref:ATP-binding protein n=1 Tax=unclassified Marinobacterium TaxID=2644139 RepID=UPI001567DB65|nr:MULTISPECIES: ATP-binding protein [unclassified Marinobacterium]NRP26931.1 Sensor protein EvgS precursor [Marinobacterium sp. xm-d-420]NRP57071.1 Sensor protein EvgS precursor [Marinobacterium sp. xm-d-510]NRP97679.1 Sensor protein EvgS precursor [Marinobacterium sp. xm-a-127]
MFKFVSKLSIGAKTIIGVALIEICAFSFLILTESAIVHDTNKALYEESARDISELFASSITNAVISFDIAEIESAISQFMQRETVLGVSVIAANDRVMASQTQSELSGLESIYDVQMPIIIDQQSFGWVEFTYDISIVDDNSNFAKLLGFQIAIGGLLLVAFFSYLLGRYLTCRIRELSKSVQSIAKGDLNTEVKVIGHDEISQFASLLEAMRKKLVEAQSVMAKSQENLAQQVESKTKELQQALRLSEESKQREADVFAILGHEIRTPISIIMMELENRESINLNLIRSNVDHTLSLIDDMSLVARAGSGRDMNVDSVDLAELFSGLITSYRQQAYAHGIRLVDEIAITGTQVKTSEKALRQIVSNLMRNAIIHSQCKTLSISADLQRINPNSAHLEVSITDDGKCIKPELQARVFESFTRGDSQTEGTGIGLSVCKELVTNMGGELVLESDGKTGSRFTFTLSLAIEEAKSSLPTSELPQMELSVLEGLSVLVVEDNLTIQLLTKKMLESKGASVVTASNGDEGLQKAKLQTFDLMLSDLMMPVMDGAEMIKTLRSMDVDTPIIGVTAATIGGERDQLLKAGADLVLAKPLKIDSIEAFLHSQSVKIVNS